MKGQNVFRTWVWPLLDQFARSLSHLAKSESVGWESAILLKNMTIIIKVSRYDGHPGGGSKNTGLAGYFSHNSPHFLRSKSPESVHMTIFVKSVLLAAELKTQLRARYSVNTLTTLKAV
jgi:hypothetical protein